MARYRQQLDGSAPDDGSGIVESFSPDRSLTRA